ncbi:MAG: hypothetical protein KJ066_00840 [Acidobacteria bacterium]|nr:hypothetical protein [Acidobacteriota bacterium]
MAICPECDADIDVDDLDVEEGDVISCEDCGSNLRVISVDPVEFDVFEDDEDDEDDLDDEDDEEEEAEDAEDDDDWED